jgi:signal transduction histidine kinase
MTSISTPWTAAVSDGLILWAPTTVDSMRFANGRGADHPFSANGVLGRCNGQRCYYLDFLPMRLSDFIRARSEEIANEWEDFARTCSPAAAKMNVDQLRDHILPLLRFVADDMDAPQTGLEQSEKAQGRQPLAKVVASEAEKHAALRIIDGFTVDQVIGEFRALRASILRFWIKYRPADIHADPTQITRFNESIDQMLTESVVRHGQLESQAREYSTSRDAFLATLSHELRGPLAAIVNGVNIVKASSVTNASLVPVAAMMSRQSQHLRRMLDDLLDLARISRNRLSLSCAPTDIRQCVQDAIDANRDGLIQGTHILKLHMPEAPVVGQLDCTRIVQLTSILLNNAVKYSGAGSRIDVSLTRDHDYALICVRDEGIGIAAEMLPRIFDAFYVTHENNLAKHGLGIGLWLARRLVEMHEGTIVAKSEGPSLGAEFSVELPLTAAAARGGRIAQSLAAGAGLGSEHAHSPINPAAESLDSKVR